MFRLYDGLSARRVVLAGKGITEDGKPVLVEVEGRRSGQRVTAKYLRDEGGLVIAGPGLETASEAEDLREAGFGDLVVTVEDLCAQRLKAAPRGR